MSFRFRTLVLEHAVLMAPGRINQPQILSYVSSLNSSLKGRASCGLDDWLSFSRLGGEPDEEFVFTPGRQPADSECRRHKPIHRLFCAREIRAMWTLFVTIVAFVRDRQPPSVSATRLDVGDLGLLLVVQTARAGGLLSAAETTRAMQEKYQDAANSSAVQTPRLSSALASPRFPCLDDKGALAAVAETFVRSCMGSFIRVACKAYEGDPLISLSDLKRLDILFKVDDSWFSSSSRVLLSDAVVGLANKATVRPAVTIRPQDFGQIELTRQPVEAVVTIGPCKREAFLLDHSALEVVVEEIGGSPRQLSVVCQGLEGCTVYVLGPVGCVRVVDCRHSKFVFCAVAAVSSLVNCTGLDAKIASRVVKIENSYDSSLSIYSLHPPVIVGDSRGLTLGPFAVSFSQLPSALKAARLPYEAAFVCSWQAPEVVSTKKQAAATDEVFKHIQPRDFWLEVAPETDTSERHALLLPDVYSNEILAKRRRIVSNLEKLRSLPRSAWIDAFYEWVSPHWREVDDLHAKYG